MLKSVLTMAFPLAGTVFFSALARSKPAERGEPRVGSDAVGLSFFTRRHMELLFVIGEVNEVALLPRSLDVIAALRDVVIMVDS